MWIQLGNDLVNLETAVRVEVDGPMLMVREPTREFRTTDPALVDEVEAHLRDDVGWIALRDRGESGTHKAMYANLAATTSIERVDGEYRMYAGEAEYASIGAAEAGSLEAALASRAQAAEPQPSGDAATLPQASER